MVCRFMRGDKRVMTSRGFCCVFFAMSSRLIPGMLSGDKIMTVSVVEMAFSFGSFTINMSMQILPMMG